MLNQAIFHNLYVDDDQITDHSLQEPFGRLHAVQQVHQDANDDKRDPNTGAEPEKSRAASQPGSGPASTNGVAVLLQGVGLAPCSSKTLTWS